MSFQQTASDLLKEGYSPQDVLESFSKLSPSHSEQLNSLKKEGYEPQDILDSIFSLSQKEEEKPGILPQVGRGALEGSLDLADLATLGGKILQYPINLAAKGAEKALVKMLGLPSERRDEGTELTGQESINRALADKNISESDFIALAGGDDEIIGQPMFPQKRDVAQEIRETIPEGGLAQEITRRGVRSLPFAATGPAALVRVFLSELGGLGAKEATKALGGGETAQLVADIAGGLGTALGGAKLEPLFRGGKALARTPRIAAKPKSGLTQAELHTRPRKIQGEINKLSSSAIEEYASKTQNLAKNTFDQPSLSARSLEKSLIDETKEGILKSAPKTEGTSQAAWRSISDAATEEFSKQRNVYRQFYRAAEHQAEKMPYLFSETAQEAETLLKKLTKIKTKVKGQNEVEGALKNISKDLGVKKKIKKALDPLSKAKRILGVPSRKVPVVRQQSVSTAKAINLKRALNDIVNYEDIAPSIKNLLRPITRSLRGEISEALDARPLVKQVYNQAEGKYAQTARTYGRDSVKQLLKADAPEAVASKAITGSHLEHLKSAIKGNTEAVNTLEGQVLRKISESSSETGKNILRETAPHLSANSRQVGSKLVDIGDKLSSSGAAAAANERVLESIQKAVTTGERPDYALKLMKNPTGYKHVKTMLNRSPKGNQTFKALQRQHVDDIFQSITEKSGEINWSKAGRVLNNPHQKTVLKEALGESGLRFFQKLEGYGKNIRANMEKFLAKQPKGVVDEITGSMGLHLKSTLASLVGKSGGLAAYLGLKAVPRLAKYSYRRILSNPTLQKAFTALTKPSKWTGRNITPVIEKLNDGLEGGET